MSVKKTPLQGVSKFEWNLKATMGGGIMSYFTEYTYLLNNSAFTDWEYFYQKWRANVLELMKHPKDPEFGNLIDDWCSFLLDYNWKEEKQTVEHKVALLNMDSLNRLEQIISRYDEQFSFLLEEATDYEDFDNLIGFLEDLPERLIESIEFLERTQSENNITVDPEPEKMEFSLTLQAGNDIRLVEDADIVSIFFYFGGGERDYVRIKKKI